MAAEKDAKTTTDTVAIEGPTRARSTFTTEPVQDEEATAPDGSTAMGARTMEMIDDLPESAAAARTPLEEAADAVVAALQGVPMPRRREVLDEADEKIIGGREAEYGEPQESFERIAALWTAREKHITDRIYTASDVAQMMALLKVARLAHQPQHSDSWVDLAGYAALGAEVSDA